MSYGSKSNNKYLVVKAKGSMANQILCAFTGILHRKLSERWIIVGLRLTTENASIKRRKPYLSIEL
jgi:hypothetical protein